MNIIILSASGLALLSYTTAFFLLWRRLSLRIRTAEKSGQTIEPGAALSAALGIALIGFLSHLVASTESLIQQAPSPTLTLTFIGVSSLVSCVIVAVSIASALRVRADNLLLLSLPLAALTVLALAVLPPGKTQPISLGTNQITHILLSISAYAALMTAALQSLLIGVQERRLRAPQSGLLGLLPPMDSMEELFITMLWLGVGLLTLSIVTGMLFLQNMFDQRLVHHTVLTSLSWLIYAGFLTGHHLFGWRGVTGVRWNLAAFILLLLGYWGSKFVLEYLL